jgi:hypothetical protein
MKTRDDGVDCFATTPSSRGAEQRGDPVARCGIIMRNDDE